MWRHWGDCRPRASALHHSAYLDGHALPNPDSWTALLWEPVRQARLSLAVDALNARFGHVVDLAGVC